MFYMSFVDKMDKCKVTLDRNAMGKKQYFCIEI